MIKVYISVTNDIVTDRRTGNIALSLHKLNADVSIIGRKLEKSLPLQDKPYKSHRIRLLFNNGPLFYAGYNIRLFLFLLFRKVDILIANDLDTLLANYLVSRIRRKKLIFDSHEYFTEVPELQGRRLVKNIWKKLEGIMLPKIKYSYTVCDSIAGIYSEQYGIDMHVIRNLPLYKRTITEITENIRLQNERIILYQGAVNMGRGLELAIRAMGFISNAVLVIIGDGDIIKELKRLADESGLNDKVRFIGRVPHEKLVSYTSQADIGISLEENLGLNYYYALPNKLFDYIHAGVPVLVSNFPEMAGIVNKYQVGLTTRTTDPEQLAVLLKEMLENKEQRDIWKKNLSIAAKELCWENEEKKLLKIFSDVIGQ